MSNLVSQEILELEALCQQLYQANSAQQIHEANKLLENFSNSADCLSKCQILLDRGIVSQVDVEDLALKTFHFNSNVQHLRVHILSIYQVLC